jgi:hypothetical protein
MREVQWFLFDSEGRVADKGRATVKETKFGYETIFNKEITVLSGDRLMVDMEYKYE